jgi:hypothetical protein
LESLKSLESLEVEQPKNNTGKCRGKNVKATKARKTPEGNNYISSGEDVPIR